MRSSISAAACLRRSLRLIVGVSSCGMVIVYKACCLMVLAALAVLGGLCANVFADRNGWAIMLMRFSGCANKRLCKGIRIVV